MRLCLIAAALVLASSLAGAAICQTPSPERPIHGVRHYARISGKPGQAGVFLLIYRQPAPAVRPVSAAGYCKPLRQPSSLPSPPSLRRQEG